MFPEKTREFEMTVDLVADMTVINPFDFFVETYAEKFPFSYPAELAHDLTPFLAIEEQGPQLKQWIAGFQAREMKPGMLTIDFLMAVNRSLQSGCQISRAHGTRRADVRADPRPQAADRAATAAG